MNLNFNKCNTESMPLKRYLGLQYNEYLLYLKRSRRWLWYNPQR